MCVCVCVYGTCWVVDEVEAAHEEGADGARLALRADPMAGRVDGQTRPGVQVRRRLLRRLGHRTAHGALAHLVR